MPKAITEASFPFENAPQHAVRSGIATPLYRYCLPSLFDSRRAQ